MHRPWTYERSSRPRFRLLSLALLWVCAWPAPVGAANAVGPTVASYHVRFSSDPPRVTVSGTAPLEDGALRIDDSWPGDIPPLDSLGWCGLVRDLRVTDADGGPLTLAANGPRGWKVARAGRTTVTFTYEVDYAQLGRLGWPAPREAAYQDADDFVLVGRSLFAFTGASRECRVTFELPEGWRASTAWPETATPGSFVASTPRDLVENLVVLTRAPREDVVVGSFRVHVHALGATRAFQPQLRPMLERIVRHHVGMLGSPRRHDYALVLLPLPGGGGESYRGSFALCVDSLSDPQARAKLGNLVAHEIFHLWNGWMLRGADYSSTQWFQEGFTEYVANLAMARSGRVEPDWFRTKLAQHVTNSRQLTTSLEEIGTHKGPPLYSAGALVALEWDVRLRSATNGRRDLGDFFRALLRRTDGGAKEYAWADLRAALEETAPGDWDAFRQAYLRAMAPSPVEPALAALGQRLIEPPTGPVRIEPDPAASKKARQRWNELLRSTRR